jgi:two-component system chemotaxis sensor kinase CheA
MENWCKQFQERKVKPPGNTAQLFINGRDLLKLLVASKGEIKSPQDLKWYDSLISKFKKDPESDLTAETDAAPLSSQGVTAGSIDYVRIRYSLIEELLGLSQEILLLEKNLPPLSQEQLSTGLKNWIDDYASILKGLHFRLAQLRLMSIDDFSNLFVRPIRDLAREHDKQIRWEIVGGNLEADITLLERLREPFIHILRNSIAHGIETTDERKLKGKESVGTILLAAKRERDKLIIKLRDDGRGIDRSAINDYLKNRRSLTDEEIARLSEEEFYETILNTDFSSTLTTTDLAGRGIGMNLVAQAIEYLGGTLEILSKPYEWTEFIIKLPVSLSIIHTLIFRIGMYTLAIPASTVASIERQDQVEANRREALYGIRALLGITDEKESNPYILKLSYPEDKYSPTAKETPMEFSVDSIIGNKPIMVMPVGELLAKIKLFSGVGIMENGDIAVLVDVDRFPQQNAG